MPETIPYLIDDPSPLVKQTTNSWDDFEQDEEDKDEVDDLEEFDLDDEDLDKLDFEEIGVDDDEDFNFGEGDEEE